MLLAIQQTLSSKGLQLLSHTSATPPHRRAIALMQDNFQLLQKQLQDGTDLEQEMVTQIGDLMYRRIALFKRSRSY